MKAKYAVIVVAFVLACLSPFVSLNFFDHVSQAHTPAEMAQMESPVPWERIRNEPDGARFIYDGLWVVVEKTYSTKTVNVFTWSGERRGNDLVLHFWSYVFAKGGRVVLSGHNPVEVSGYFAGDVSDPDVAYVPPSSIFVLYTDPEAERMGLEKFREGMVGLELDWDEESGVILPWVEGAVTRRSENPG